MSTLKNTSDVKAELANLVTDFKDLAERYKIDYLKATKIQTDTGSYLRGLFRSRIDSFNSAGEWVQQIIDVIEEPKSELESSYVEVESSEETDVMYGYQAMLMMEDTLRGEG